MLKILVYSGAAKKIVSKTPGVKSTDKKASPKKAGPPKAACEKAAACEKEDAPAEKIALVADNSSAEKADVPIPSENLTSETPSPIVQ